MKQENTELIQKMINDHNENIGNLNEEIMRLQTDLDDLVQYENDHNQENIEVHRANQERIAFFMRLINSLSGVNDNLRRDVAVHGREMNIMIGAFILNEARYRELLMNDRNVIRIGELEDRIVSLNNEIERLRNIPQPQPLPQPQPIVGPGGGGGGGPIQRPPDNSEEIERLRELVRRYELREIRRVEEIRILYEMMENKRP